MSSVIPIERNARIERTMLGYEDHGILTAAIHLDYGSSGQAFGNLVLRGPYMARFVQHVLATVGVSTWEQLTGKHVRVRHNGHMVHAIGHIIEDRWFTPADDMERDA